MTGLEIVLFVLGAAFVIISFFIVDGNKENAEEKLNFSAEPNPEMIQELKEKLKNAADSESEKIINDTENQLNKLTNDKIMAVSELSEQILEKVNNNHQEVVFLYQLLKDKEEELKQTVGNLDKVRIDCDKLVREYEIKKNEYEVNQIISPKVISEELADSIIPEQEIDKAFAEAYELGMAEELEKNNMDYSAEAFGEKKDSENNNSLETSLEDDALNVSVPKTTNATEKAPVKKVVNTVKKETGTRPRKKTTTTKNQGVNISEKVDASVNDRNAEILALYKKKKSVMEISKLLGMGQGEVKLIIDLYGK